ncbi:MAG: hypothetical protein Q4F09_07095 [Erysipelotrichaceae bacterium]|nr:hypothetical protein [Erysipelotrichaceae bacterium]
MTEQEVQLFKLLSQNLFEMNASLKSIDQKLDILAKGLVQVTNNQATIYQQMQAMDNNSVSFDVYQKVNESILSQLSDLRKGVGAVAKNMDRSFVFGNGGSVW